jgi:hypothetical protein
MPERDLPLTVFDEKVLQRYLFFILHSEDVNDRSARQRMEKLENYPTKRNLIIPEVIYYNAATTDDNDKEKKIIDYGHDVNTPAYKPDFVIYHSADESRVGPLSGSGRFLEVKWDYEQRFGEHQWMALMKNKESIVASINEPTEDEWKEMVKQKAAELMIEYPSLKDENWLVNAHENIEHYHIDSEHFRDWAIRNVGTLVDNQLNVGGKRYWLMLMNRPMMNNWHRMLNEKKKPFWAWINQGKNLSTLMEMSDGDEVMFVEAKSHSGQGRWRFKNIDEKQLEKDEYSVKSMYHLKIISRKGKSAYRCYLGDCFHSTFFETCTNSSCTSNGCEGCGGGEKRSMNNVEWPHFIEMEIIGSPFFLEEWKRLSRGGLHKRLGENGSKPFTPAELSRDEFGRLKGQITNK